MIATSRPEQIKEIVARYDKEREGIEANLMDLILYSGGATTWTELMSMPITSVRLMTARLNKKTEDENQIAQKARASRGR